ncbi:hypothetical protein FIBSPDRAFT_917651 [Athelia psychrophila]|uniref:Uncharacterized protein n=1 Tax=Athelia psychrophila TaxID=1759441 RepID=A0A166RL13_9AGAM|nr:hypothetical protein FIBSPDRAFT_917651 [Fibularhizoctonia sp. CBS 109695]
MERDEAQEEMGQQSEVLAGVQLDRDELSTRAAGLEERGKLLKFSIEQLNRQLNDELNQSKALKGQLDRREMDMQMLSNALAQLKAQHMQTVTQLDARTTELKGAQAFLPKADTTSGASVVRMIEGLDAEIMQMSAFVADHFEFEHPKPYHMNEDVQAASTRLAELIGPKMVDLLATTEHAQDPLVIQLACQTATSTYCRYIVTSWDIDDDNFNHLLQEAYLTIHGAGMSSSGFKLATIDQALRQRSKAMIHGDADLSFIIVPRLAAYIADIVMVAGLQAPEAAIHEVIMQAFEENMSVVVRLALSLNWVTGRDITSADLEPCMVLWETVFDPATMEDVHARPAHLKPKSREESIKKEDHVLCTTDLGLRRTRIWRGELQKCMLLKPKVALQSVIEGLEVVKPYIMESPMSMASHESWPYV